MKKNLLYLVMISLAFVSCEDKRLDGMEPDRVYLPKAGMQIEESYTIGEMAHANLWAHKSSFNGTSCQVLYTIDSKVLEAYNAANGTSYEILPESYYQIPKSTINIPGTEEYGYFTVNYSPEKILELCGGVYDLKKYALPFRISSLEVEVTDKNTSVLVFQVKEPVVKMASKKVDGVSFPYGETALQMSSAKFGMDFKSRWDCAYTLETDATKLQEALDAFNATSSMKYTLLPQEYYQMPGEGVVKIGMNSVAVDLKIDPSKCPAGFYAIPILLASVDSPLHLSESDRMCMVPVICKDEYLSKQGWTVKVSSVNPNYGKPEYLVDDNLDTYWHPAGRDFGAGRDNYPYAIVDMKQSYQVSCFEIDPRKDQFYPQIFSNLRCFVSEDGVEFTQVGYVATPWSAIVKCTVYTQPAEGRYVKFTIDYPAGQTSIAFAELSIRGHAVE